MYARIQKLCCTFLLILCLIPSSARAASGMPDSARFGYGGRVDLRGRDLFATIEEAGRLNLDWIAVDFDWQHLQPSAEQTPLWNELDEVMARAQENEISVMISINQVPSWAMTENGPDPQMTADLAASLAHRYPGTLLALELFPSANTFQGWGTQPNPQAYSLLLKTTWETLNAIDPGIALVAGGLTPLSSSGGGIDDLVFLAALYQAGAAEYMPIVGVHLPSTGQDPLTANSQNAQPILRHYEALRQVMVENGHKSGLLWITAFSWDSKTLPDPNDQAAWLKQAYLLFRSQLYIGAAFFDGLNPDQTGKPTLFYQNGQPHPGFEELVQIIAQDHNSQTVQINLEWLKKLSNKDHLKGNQP
jgi:hypothetical protein